VVIPLRSAEPRQRRLDRLAAGPAPCEEPHCEVELTDIVTPGQDWWTLGFEATGPADLLRRELQATAALVFAKPLPVGVELSADKSSSYVEWLGQRSGAESDADALKPPAALIPCSACGPQNSEVASCTSCMASCIGSEGRMRS
jgi:hypothetical protein